MSSPSGPVTFYCAECGRPSSPDELARFGDLLICPVCKDSYAQKLREGVAPAAAVEYGGFWIRFVALIIDRIILGIVGSIVFFALGGSVLNMSSIQPGADPVALFSAMAGVMGLAWIVT